MICFFSSSASLAELDPGIADEVDAPLLDALAEFVFGPPSDMVFELDSWLDPASVMDRDAEGSPDLDPKKCE